MGFAVTDFIPSNFNLFSSTWNKHMTPQQSRTILHIKEEVSLLGHSSSSLSPRTNSLPTISALDVRGSTREKWGEGIGKMRKQKVRHRGGNAQEVIKTGERHLQLGKLKGFHEGGSS